MSTSGQEELISCRSLPNEDLALLLGIQPKELRNLCGLLRQDRMMAVYVDFTADAGVCIN